MLPAVGLDEDELQFMKIQNFGIFLILINCLLLHLVDYFSLLYILMMHGQSNIK